MDWETIKIVWLALLWYLLYCSDLQNQTHNIWDVCLYIADATPTALTILIVQLVLYFMI